MLGICSHEPHFSLLREEVKFGRAHPPKKGKAGGKDKKPPPPTRKCVFLTLIWDTNEATFSINNFTLFRGVNETKFHLLHLSLLREYLAWEFVPVKVCFEFCCFLLVFHDSRFICCPFY